ncbi:MAG: dienelactone hydrolase family protein [Tepidisphaeraceae bacterium]
MRLTALPLLAALFASAAFAQTTQPVGPADEAGAKKVLETSPRHGEFVDIDVAGKPVKCWVVYPEIKDKAPVVIVIQEIFGLSDWLRATTDQLAAEGFIAIAPDLVSGKGPDGGGTDSFKSRDDVVKATRELKPDITNAMLDAVADYAGKIPSANGKIATVGFCWGGGASFAYAAHNPNLAAAVVAYGTPPKGDEFKAIAAPVLGLYGGDDARVTATVPAAEAAMKAAGKSYEPHIFDGAGHGFFRQQTGKNGANRKAVDEGWPTLVAFLKKHAG